MCQLTVTYKEETILLTPSKDVLLYMDEDITLQDFSTQELFLLLRDRPLEWSLAYYDDSCEICDFKRANQQRHFTFLESQFTLFTKEGAMVKTNLDPDYEPLSFHALKKAGLVTDLYLVSLTLCLNCHAYSLQIECVE